MAQGMFFFDYVYRFKNKNIEEQVDEQDFTQAHQSWESEFSSHLRIPTSAL